MRIAVFGLGYVGIVSAACLAERGHEVIGVDPSHDKVAMVAQGKSTIVEERIGELVEEAVRAGRLTATTEAAEAVGASDLALICVGTPSSGNGSLSTMYLERVADELGAAIATLGRRYTVVFRSTMLPGTCEGTLIPRLEAASGLKAGDDFGVAVNPEFLREGTSVRDFNDPPKTVVGTLDPVTADTVASLYDGLPGVVHRVPISVAEMTKYADNSFHALKIGFANEMGAICQAYGVDSHAVMEVFASDTKLNISRAYLRPGFAFGGSCLPKDLRAIVYHARRADLSVPILENVISSNEAHLRRVYDRLIEGSARRVALLGLAFKQGTDDLRESPMVELAERLLGRGFDLSIHDAHVRISHLTGSNRAYVDARIPHLSRLMVATPMAAVFGAEVVVLASTEPESVEAATGAQDALLVDLVRRPELTGHAGGYLGAAW
jgi:GDP-mannose 6-dehydrogenase